MILRVVVIAPIVVQYDAISAAARNTWRMLSATPGWHVSLLTTVNEHPDVPARIVGGIADLLVDPDFCAADVLIYHFGIHHPLFDALLVGNGHARQIVRFHNITPPELLGPEAGPVIARSFAQLHALSCADRIWADSAENAAVLARHNVGLGKTEVLPLAVDWPPLGALAGKPVRPIEALFVGRIVSSKGLADLISVLDDSVGIRLNIVGNLRFSDPDYLEHCRALVAARHLEGCIRFLGTVDSESLQNLYATAHILTIPSYHEGFCKPAVEALRAGCVPIGYADSNLPAITGGLGKLVPPGDLAALGAALRDIAGAIRSERALPLDSGVYSRDEFDAAAKRHVATFAFDRLAAMTVSRVSRVTSDLRPTRPEIMVLPDSEMRERNRSSLNRLPDLSDWEAGGRLTDIMRELRQPVVIHRKSWEYAVAIDGLSQLGVAGPDSVGLAVGAGSEPPLFYYANEIARMVATDLYDNPQHEGTPAMLADPRSFAPFPYREDRLEVYRMGGDQLGFADETFDFVFCLSSIEHFGSRDTQRRSLDEMARVLKPGGIAAIITELILTHHSDREYFRWDEIEAMFLRHPSLRLVGGMPDLSISASVVDYPVDLEHSRHINRSPHIVLKRGPMLWTSFSMFLQRSV